mmetsp:Transcript_12189/g.21625  ORF Transcript_12189/g.21625 Transcript_12189/m.21625 type:complete len:140 (+) Transcript_12189:795-1214(+)
MDSSSTRKLSSTVDRKASSSKEHGDQVMRMKANAAFGLEATQMPDGWWSKRRASALRDDRCVQCGPNLVQLEEAEALQALGVLSLLSLPGEGERELRLYRLDSGHQARHPCVLRAQGFIFEAHQTTMWSNEGSISARLS